MTFSHEESIRYSRHLNLPNFDLDSQMKLKKASVLLVGAGALSCSALPYLVAAGVGKIGLVDHDTVDLSNLQRQILYTVDDIGAKKVHAARARLQALNPHVQIVPIDAYVDKQSIAKIAAEYDIIVDACDNFPTRYLINDYCVLNQKINVHASIFQFKGQLSVFNMPTPEGRSSNYRDLYPVPPRPEDTKSCAEAGVIGALPGIMGSMQALECIKIITGIGQALINAFLFLDTFDFQTQKFTFAPDDTNPLIGLNAEDYQNFDYEEFCGIKKINEMKSITVAELNQWITENKNFQLIDVREDHEYEQANLNGEHIPMNTIPDHVARVSKDMDVVIHCRSGVRSANVIQYLNQTHGFDNLYNLEGGIMAWAREIDPSIQIA